MAIALAEVSAGKRTHDSDKLITQCVVRLSAANADAGASSALGVAHAGPSGESPEYIVYERVPTTGGGTEAAVGGWSVYLSNVDTTNDEVDLIGLVTDPGATREAEFRVTMYWKDHAPQDRSSIASDNNS